MSRFDDMLLVVEKPAIIKLKDPAGRVLKDASGREAFIAVLSSDSQKVQETVAAAMRARQGLDGEELRKAVVAAEAETLAKLSVDWYLVGFSGKPILGDDGNPLPFSVENARELYNQPGAALWREQVRGASMARENFMPAPPSA